MVLGDNAHQLCQCCGCGRTQGTGTDSHSGLSLHITLSFLFLSLSAPSTLIDCCLCRCLVLCFEVARYLPNCFLCFFFLYLLMYFKTLLSPDFAFVSEIGLEPCTCTPLPSRVRPWCGCVCLSRKANSPYLLPSQSHPSRI